MTNILKLAFLAVTILSLPSCVGFREDQNDATPTASIAQKTAIPPPHQDQQKPVPTVQPNYACTNSVKFNIAFSKNRHFAYIIFPAATDKETLKDNHVASGAEYGNDKLLYKEYKGRTILVHLAQGNMRTDACHKIHKKKKH